jgi:hypothetical protein
VSGSSGPRSTSLCSCLLLVVALAVILLILTLRVWHVVVWRAGPSSPDRETGRSRDGTVGQHTLDVRQLAVTPYGTRLRDEGVASGCRRDIVG